MHAIDIILPSIFPVSFHQMLSVLGENSFSRTSELPSRRKHGKYYWQELPQVSFLSRQNASFVATKVWLSWQTICREKICLSRQNCCCDKYLSRQNYVCILLSRQTRVCRDKTRLLSRQKYGCLDKSFVATNTCSIKVVAPANDREKNVPSNFKCAGGKFLQSSKQASILL